MFGFVNNDTIALLFLGIVAFTALVLKYPDVTNIALGAVGGYIGSKAMPENKPTDAEPKKQTRKEGEE